MIRLGPKLHDIRKRSIYHWKSCIYKRTNKRTWNQTCFAQHNKSTSRKKLQAKCRNTDDQLQKPLRSKRFETRKYPSLGLRLYVRIQCIGNPATRVFVQNELPPLDRGVVSVEGKSMLGIAKSILLLSSWPRRGQGMVPSCNPVWQWDI